MKTAIVLGTRPEAIEVGANILAGTNPNMILKRVKKMVTKEISWEKPFGDGSASKNVIAILCKRRAPTNSNKLI